MVPDIEAGLKPSQNDGAVADAATGAGNPDSCKSVARPHTDATPKNPMAECRSAREGSSEASRSVDESGKLSG